MVTVLPASSSATSTSTSTGNYRIDSENPPPHHDDSPKHHRSPLAPSVEKDNAAPAPRRPRSKDVSSRYLAPPPASYSTATVTPSSRSSSISPLFSSPTVAQRCSVPPALNRHSVEKRSQSISRVNPLTPRIDSQAENSAVARVQHLRTRSFSVSFQGEPFFYKTSRPKNTSSILVSKSSPERRLAGEVAVMPARDGDHSENSRPLVKQPRWPGARARASNPLTRSLDCPSSRSPSTVQLLREPMVFGHGNQRSPVDGADLSASSDNDNMSSEVNSGSPQLGAPPVEKVAPRGIGVQARVLQETSSRQLRLPNSDLFLPPVSSSSTLQSESGLMRKSSVTNPSSFRRLIRSPSLANYLATPSRGMASPQSIRSGTNMTVSPSDQTENAPSIISFAAEVRRSKKGENRIEKAHMLRLLDNRYFQWRFVNAKITATLLSKKVIAEKNIYDAGITTSNLRDSVSFKRSKLQILMDSLKLTSVLDGQITYLDEWSLMDSEHSNSLHGVVEGLKATTLRLPIVNGAKAYIQDLKHAVGSAAEVMQSIGSSVCSMSSMVEGAKSIISEVAKRTVEERSLLDQSKHLLSAIAAMHVAQCSLQCHIMQLLPKSSHVQI